MFKHYFERIDNIAIYPIISLSIFFLFFLLLLLWVVRVDKGYLSKMQNLPLEHGDQDQLFNTSTTEIKL